MFQLAEKTDQNLKSLTDMLEALPPKIEVLQSLEVGLDVLGKERSMDLVLITEFKSLDDLGTYAGHPEHLKVIDWVTQNVSLVKAIDFEF